MAISTSRDPGTPIPFDLGYRPKYVSYPSSRVIPVALIQRSIAKLFRKLVVEKCVKRAEEFRRDRPIPPPIIIVNDESMTSNGDEAVAAPNGVYGVRAPESMGQSAFLPRSSVDDQQALVKSLEDPVSAATTHQGNFECFSTPVDKAGAHRRIKQLSSHDVWLRRVPNTLEPSSFARELLENTLSGG